MVQCMHYSCVTKRAVTVISTIHEATEVVTKKKQTGENVIKFETNFSYTNIISSINLGDQYLATYSFFEKEV